MEEWKVREVHQGEFYWNQAWEARTITWFQDGTSRKACKDEKYASSQAQNKAQKTT